MDITLIPETAPFNAEQRAWLNGFLAGWLGLREANGTDGANGTALNGAAALGAASNGAATPALPAAETKAEAEPWHDPALPIDERLKLAEGKPLARRLMAAMAQLDCGSCGYLCKTYSEAIAHGSETSLTLCSPGGSETAKALKRLVKENKSGTDGAATNITATNGAVTNGTAADGMAKPSPNGLNGWSRKNPFTAKLLRTVNLNGPGSEKETRHIEIDLAGGPSYEVGDSLGIIPENCGALVDDLIAALGAKDDEPVTTVSGAETTLRDALARHCCLKEISEDLLEQLAHEAADPEQASQLRALVDDDAPISGFDLLDLLRRFPSARPSPADLVAALAELKPRLYSISSSPKRHAGQVHLTVRRVAFESNGRSRKGVASTMLADRVEPGAALRVFVQKSHGFTIPADPNAPAIMIGPGTGIAPFRAFLHERDALGAKGPNWLFFGDQRSTEDFLYEDELTDFLRRGVLTRLDTAFSRDQSGKIYVQHRISQRGADLFDWLEHGAHVFVCGDAKRMAADVDRALREVVRVHGRMSEEQAAAYIAALASSGRYCRDVY
ncbi:MAG TPA: sulfite reductase subunit alpha [Isosphaeraceae bacterium]|nr:sulfite reductase subunit alpha [Isosphaeraceae bacterium]